MAYFKNESRKYFSFNNNEILIMRFSSGNHERDWPGSGSFYGNMDSGGECGVLAETMFYVPASNRAKFWYGRHCFICFLFRENVTFCWI